MSHFKHQFWTGLGAGVFARKHIKAMGQSIHLFGWLTTSQTSVNDKGYGVVNYGHPVKLARICYELDGVPRRTVQRWIGRLRATGYIITENERSHDGITFWIAKAKVKTHKEADAKMRRAHLEAVKSHTPKMAHEKPGSGPNVAHEDVSFILQTVQKATLAAESVPPITKSISYYNKDTRTDSVRSLPDWLKEMKSKTAIQRQGLTQAQLDERRRKLLDQADLLRKKYPVQEKAKC